MNENVSRQSHKTFLISRRGLHRGGFGLLPLQVPGGAVGDVPLSCRLVLEVGALLKV